MVHLGHGLGERFGTATNGVDISPAGVVSMAGTGRVYHFDTFTFDYANITGQGKPTLVTRGVADGFSLPVYNSDNEELFACKCIPSDWDGGNVTCIVGGWLPSANNANKFNLQVSWETWSPTSNTVVPTSVTDVPVETTTGNWSAYASFKVEFTIAINGLASAGDIFAFRIRRLAASGDEIDGEVVVQGASIKYIANKLGQAVT